MKARGTGGRNEILKLVVVPRSTSAFVTQEFSWSFSLLTRKTAAAPAERFIGRCSELGVAARFQMWPDATDARALPDRWWERR